MSDFDVAPGAWESAAEQMRIDEENRKVAEAAELRKPFTAKEDLGKISDIQSLEYEQGAYKYNGHYGQAVRTPDGEIVGYEFVQHDITPGMMSVFRTDPQGNITQTFQTKEGKEDWWVSIAANVAAAYLGGPAAVAAMGALQGKDLGDIAKAAALTYVGGQIASGVSGAESVIDTLGQTGANIAGRVAGAVATGQDPIAALATAGLGQTVGESLGMTDTMASTVGSSLVGGVTAELRGKDATIGAISGAVSGYFSGEKNARDLKIAADADIAGGMVPEYGTNEAYDSFMQSAMTPEAQLSIEQSISDRADMSGGYDATEFEGSLAKDADQTTNALGEVFKPMSGTDALKTGVKAALTGGAVAAGASIVNNLSNNSTTTTSTATSNNNLDIYKDAPIKGYHMKQDEVTGKWIPYIGDRALLAKGGFVSRR